MPSPNETMQYVGSGFDLDPNHGPERLVFESEVAEAVSQVMASVKRLGYDDKNNSGNYGFVSVDKFFGAIGPLMAEAGLHLAMQELDTDLFETQGFDRDGAPKAVKWLRCRYAVFLCHKSGKVNGPFTRTIIVLMTGPQAFGSAESYVQKRFLRMQFLVPTGDKDDADLSSPQDTGTARAPTVTKPRAQTAAAPATTQVKAQTPKPAAQRQPAAAPQQANESEDPAAAVKFTSPQPVRGPGIVETKPQELEVQQDEPSDGAELNDTQDIEEPRETTTQDRDPGPAPEKINGPLPKNHPIYQAAIKEYNAINQKQVKAQTKAELTELIVANDARLSEMVDIAPEVATAVGKLRAAIENRMRVLK